MDHRLSLSVTPEKYTLHLEPDLEKFTFHGEETIVLTVKEPTNTITLHANELQVVSAVLRSADGSEEQKGEIYYDEEKERVEFKFVKEILPGKKELVLSFDGVLNDRMRGFYRSQYEVEGQKMHMAVTQLESTDARRLFPSFDEPSHKAVFEVSVLVPPDHTAISNTIEEVVTEHETGYKIVKFAPTPKMSTYLLAVLVGKFEYVQTKTKEGITVRVFTVPGKKKQAEFALETAAKLLSFYNTYFGYDYPLSVCDLIAVPDFDAGAMENWGAVTFRETALLIDPIHSSAANKQRVALIIAHELAHMWFGNLVTMEWWTHLWLNEGFACYIEYLATDVIFPEWEIWDQFIAMEHNDALSLDALKNTHPIEVEVKHPSEIVEIFDQVSYAKGASVIHMLATYMGADVFRDGLRAYLKKHAYKNAKTEDLWDALENVSGQKVRDIMHNWTSKPGHPVISVIQKNGKIELSQKRFFSSPLSRLTSRDTTVWQVPMGIVTGNKTEEILISKTSQLSAHPQGWFKLNAKEASVVRAMYTKEFLDLLKEPIATKALSTVDRLGVIRDAFDLAYAGYMSTPDTLDFVQSFKDETEYVVWLEIAGQMQKISGLLAEDAKVYEEFKKFGKTLFSKIAEKVRWEKIAGESQTQILLRAIALSQVGMYGDSKTITTAHMMFKDFIENGNTIDPDIRGVIYILAAENGGQKEFETFKALYKKEELHQEKDRIARAMVSFKDHTILENVLLWILSEDVRTQDKTRIIYIMFTNPFARSLTWGFVKKNWKYFSKQFSGSHGMSRLVEGAGELTTENDAQDVVAFFNEHPTAELARTVQQIEETILSRADWIRREKERVSEFLKDQS